MGTRTSDSMSRTPRALEAALLLLGGIFFSPSPVLGAKVLVLPYQCLGKGVPPELTEQATTVITREMSQGGLTVLASEDLVDALPEKRTSGGRRAQDAPTGDPAAGAKAEQLLSRAKSAVEESEFAGAIKELKSAVRLLEENGDAVPDLRLLPEAYLQLGAAHFRDGSEDEGDDMLNKAVHLDPERELDPADYPPIFIRVFERARFNVLRRPRASIEVKAAKGAQVLFDGRNMGKAPLVLREALPGNHWIRIERPGEPVQVKKVSLRANKTMIAEFEGAEGASNDAPVGVLGVIGQNEMTREHVAQIRALGARAGADFVMIGGIYKTDTAYNIRTAFVAVTSASVGRLADIAFDLDMLSAEIEVYKLAEDAKNQATGGSLTRVIAEDRFLLAPGLKTKIERRERKPPEETKVALVLAAPPAPPPPQAPAIAEAPAPEDAPGGAGADGKSGALGKGRAPLSREGGEKEPAAAEPTDGTAPPPSDRAIAASPSAVPKDEAPEPAAAEIARPPATSGVGRDASLVLSRDRDEERLDQEPSTWWLWVIGGVLAAGALGAGGYFIASGQTPSEGNLRITW